LGADADAEAGEHLVGEPSVCAGRHSECGEQAGTGGEEDRAGEHEGLVVAEFGDAEAAEEDGEDEGNDEREVAETRGFGACVLDGLEPEWEL
jgi:hypothetical protein